MKKKQWVPETERCYAEVFVDFDKDGNQCPRITRFTSYMKTNESQVRVRIIRDKDWQKIRKLLRLARKATPKRTP